MYASLSKLLHKLLVHGQLYGTSEAIPHRNVTQLIQTAESSLLVQTQKYNGQARYTVTGPYNSYSKSQKLLLSFFASSKFVPCLVYPMFSYYKIPWPIFRLKILMPCALCFSPPWPPWCNRPNSANCKALHSEFSPLPRNLSRMLPIQAVRLWCAWSISSR
jgi:hypothetical protein